MRTTDYTNRNSSIIPQNDNICQEPNGRKSQKFGFSKQIGATTYKVVARFNESSKMSFEEKVLRSMKMDLQFLSERATMGLPQTGALLERSSA